MKNLKKYRIIFSIIFVITLFVLGGISYLNLTKPEQKYIHQYALYPLEAKKPEWVSKNSQLVVKGQVLERMNSAKGISPANGLEVIYTDAKVRVDKVISIRTSLGRDVKKGDIITIRALGGSIDNVTMKTEADPEFAVGENVMLFLVDGPQMPALPTSSNSFYGLTGDIHGYFTLKPDGMAERRAVGDFFKVQDLENITLSAK